MLADRVVSVTGVPNSMKSGSCVTEHDVLHDGWYLDGGRIPTCIAVEAGQADGLGDDRAGGHDPGPQRRLVAGGARLPYPFSDA
jgi:hypothetical protein